MLRVLKYNTLEFVLYIFYRIYDIRIHMLELCWSLVLTILENIVLLGLENKLWMTK